jgi:cytochrome b involved in lipid metabolism
MRRKITLGIGIVLVIFLSGCLFTIDPQSLEMTPLEPPVDEIPSTPPIIVVPETPIVPEIVNPPIPPDPVVPPVVQPPVQFPVVPTITLSSSVVGTHSAKKDCWMIISGNVYNLSAFVNHPGGNDFVPYCGKDGTKPYNAQGHSGTAKALLKKYFLGKLNEAILASQASG